MHSERHKLTGKYHSETLHGTSSFISIAVSQADKCTEYCILLQNILQPRQDANRDPFDVFLLHSDVYWSNRCEPLSVFKVCLHRMHMPDREHICT